MKAKNAQVAIKAGPDDGLPEGTFTAYASVFDNKDSYGDVVRPGAFTDTLEQWKSSGMPIPLLFGHNMSDPDFNIGHVETAVQDEKGLLVTAALDLDNPKSAQTYRLLKGRRINQMSFAYDVLEGGFEKDEANPDGYYELRKLKLHEVSVVPLGANPETEVLAVKAALEGLAAGEKVGRVLAAKHIDSLRSAQEAIATVIAAAEADQEKASAAGTAKDEEPRPNGQAKSEEPPGPASVDDLATRIRLLTLKGRA